MTSYPEAKGKKNGLCNRSACLSPLNVIFFNKGTHLYYCETCADLINEANKNDPETLRLTGDTYLCRTDEGKLPYGL